MLLSGIYLARNTPHTRSREPNGQVELQANGRGIANSRLCSSGQQDPKKPW